MRKYLLYRQTVSFFVSLFPHVTDQRGFGRALQGQAETRRSGASRGFLQLLRAPGFGLRTAPGGVQGAGAWQKQKAKGD